MFRASCLLSLVAAACAASPNPSPEADQVRRYLEARLHGDVEAMAAEVRSEDRELEREGVHAAWSSPDHRVLRVGEPRQLAVFEAEMMAPDAEQFAACLREGVTTGEELNERVERCKKAAPDTEQTARVVLELTEEGWRVISLSAALSRYYAERRAQDEDMPECPRDAEIALLTGEPMRPPPSEPLTRSLLEKLIEACLGASLRIPGAAKP